MSRCQLGHIDAQSYELKKYTKSYFDDDLKDNNC